MKNEKNYSCLYFINNLNKINQEYLSSIFIETYNDFIQSGKDIKGNIKIDYQTNKFIVDLTFITPDWKGIIETIAGFIHFFGYNITLTYAFIFPHEQEKKSFLLYRFELSPEEFEKFNFKKAYILSIIERSTIQSAPINYLISMEIGKLNKYEEVYELIQKKRQNEIKDYKEQINEESIKFFTNRTKSYISDREARDLLEQIVSNFMFIKKLRKTPEEKFLFNIKNLHTEREYLTGISVVAIDGSINLNMILVALRKSVPNFIIKFVKKFSVDNISCYRIEICDSEHSWFTKDAVRRISTALETLKSQGYLLGLESFDSVAGYEQYARAIIPILRNESKKTQIPQFYISLENKQEFFVEFKILIVYNCDCVERTDFLIDFAKELNEIQGFHIFKISPISKYEKNLLNMVDIRVETQKWPEGLAIYDKIKEILKHYLNNFRDFDEGMRIMDKQKLSFIMNNINDAPKDLIMNFYYHLNEFYRISTRNDEILDIITECVKVYQKIISQPLSHYLKEKPIEIELEEGRKKQIGHVVYIAYRYQEKKLKDILTVLNDIEVNFSRVDFEGVTILLIIIKSENSQTQTNMRTMIKALEKTLA